MFTAIIKEQECIGCSICVDVCPFDAIIGARGQMHTVLTAECIGCKLCVDPCPVDCIEIVFVEVNQSIIELVANARQRRIAKLARLKTAGIHSLAKQDTVSQELQALGIQTKK